MFYKYHLEIFGCCIMVNHLRAIFEIFINLMPLCFAIGVLLSL